MADERGVIIGDRVEARLDKLREDVSELKGTVSQMDKRLSNVETGMGDVRKDVRQVLFVVLGTWVTTMLAVISLSVTILSRLK